MHVYIYIYIYILVSDEKPDGRLLKVQLGVPKNVLLYIILRCIEYSITVYHVCYSVSYYIIVHADDMYGGRVAGSDSCGAAAEVY